MAMTTRAFGATGTPVAAIGQGTWYIERAPRAEAIAALHAGLDAGMTHIDTAELYGSGKAEEIVGEAIAGRREKVFLVSKVMPQNASRSGTIAACEASLGRLRTDRLDCFLLHWRGRHPLADTIAAFEQLAEAGKIRSWGVSNFDADDLAEAAEIAGPGRIACNQVLYHLGQRGIEHEVVPWCEANGVAVVGYSPFGHNRFAGGKALDAVAARHDATPRQVALAFLTRRPSLLTIPKAARAGHVRENAGAGGLALSADDIATIDAAFPVGRRGPLEML